MQFMNREIAQNEEELARLAAEATQAVAQAAEDHEAFLAAKAERWYRHVLTQLGISMDLVRPQKIMIEIEPLTMLPVVTIVCQPNIDIERLISAEYLDEPDSKNNEGDNGNGH